MFAVSLAGSLFFSISPTAAKDKVLLYLLLTMGPFAVVAPGPGPAHRPQPGGPAGHGGGLGPGPGRALPLPGPGHPLAAAVPRGLRHAGAVQGLPGDQGRPGPRDGGPRHARRRRRRPGPGRRPRPRTRPGRRRPRSPPAARARAPAHPALRHAAVVHVDDPGDRARTWSSRTWPPSTPAWACWPRCPGSSSPCRPWPSSSWPGRPAVLWVVRGRVRRRGGGRAPGCRCRRRAGRAGRAAGRRRRSAAAGAGAGGRCRAGPRTSTTVAGGRRGPGRLPAHRRHRGAPGPDAHVGAEGPGRVPHLPVRLRPPPRGRRHLVVRPAARAPSPPAPSSACCWSAGSAGC